jgi:hypothetical protein
MGKEGIVRFGVLVKPAPGKIRNLVCAVGDSQYFVFVIRMKHKDGVFAVGCGPRLIGCTKGGEKLGIAPGKDEKKEKQTGSK